MKANWTERVTYYNNPIQMHNEVNIRRIEGKFSELINLEEHATKAQPTLSTPFELEDAFSKVLSRQSTRKTSLK